MDNIITGTAVYVVTWWLVLFMALPFGVKQTRTEDLELGQEPGAPAKPMMWRKVIITTAITTVLWFFFDWLGDSGMVNFRPER